MSVTVDGSTLMEKWDEAQQLFEQIEGMSANDPRFKDTLQRALRAFQTCAVLVSEKSLFSENEELEEIATSSLKYLAVPFYLAELTQKIPSANPHERLPHLQQAMNYYKKYLATCSKLKIMQKQHIDSYLRDGPLDPETKRNEKIERFRRKTEIQKNLKALMKQKLEQGLLEEENAEDNETERNFSMLLLEQSAVTSLDNQLVLNEEISILDHMAKLMLANNGKLPEIQRPPPGPAPAPLVIRDQRREVMANAFKPGWNLPTVSVEEANYIDAQEAMQRSQKEKAKEAQQKMVEEWGDNDLDKEDEAQVYKDREMDDWKDLNPKGSGNTGTLGYKY